MGCADVGVASDTIEPLRCLAENGEGRGEKPLSEKSVVEGDEAQPKKVPSLDEPGDLGSGLFILDVVGVVWRAVCMLVST